MSTELDLVTMLETKQHMDRTAFDLSVKILRDKYKDMPLRYGYIGYTPFVSIHKTNGTFQPKGLMVDLIHNLASEIGVKVKGVRIKWGEIEDALDEGKVDIIIDPIVEGRLVGLVYYGTIRTPLLIYRRGDIASIVERSIGKLKHSLRVSDPELRDSLLRSISFDFVNIRIGATTGSIEQKIIEQILKIRTNKKEEIKKLFNNQDMSNNILQGLQNECVVVADEPSFKKVLPKLHDLEYGVDSQPLFPDDFKYPRLPIGFAIKMFDLPLQIFLSLENKFSHNGFISAALESLKKSNAVKDIGITIVNGHNMLTIQQRPFALDAIRYEVQGPSQLVEPSIFFKRSTFLEDKLEPPKVGGLERMNVTSTTIISSVLIITGFVLMLGGSFLGVICSVSGGVLLYEVGHLWYKYKKRYL